MSGENVRSQPEGSQDSLSLSRVYGNSLTRIPAGELKLSTVELAEGWLLDRVRKY